MFDDDRSGSISVNNIKRVAKELGETMNVTELEEMLQRASGNGREISREDFYNIMTKKTFWFVNPITFLSFFLLYSQMWVFRLIFSINLFNRT